MKKSEFQRLVLEWERQTGLSFEAVRAEAFRQARFSAAPSPERKRAPRLRRRST